MATKSPEGCCLTEEDQLEFQSIPQGFIPSYVPRSSVDSVSSQQDYDFIDSPDQDYYCPVSLSILLDPHQTTCCGHHISQEAAHSLVKDGKPCPMCKSLDFATQEDKYFRRKVKGLKVTCHYKSLDCDWIGELGHLEHHLIACPKRPWKCPYCDFETTFDTGPNTHMSVCARYPEPCPNQCEVGTVPRSEIDGHLKSCPLQIVECDFAQAGCRIMIPRKDVTTHMAENVQGHLMNATLQTLQLTKHLHHDMKEKDQQIAALQAQVTGLMNKLSVIEQRTETVGYSCHTFTLIKFKEYQSFGSRGSWYSDKFYSSPGGYCFKLNIDTNGVGDAQGSHLSAALYLQSGAYDNDLKWPIKCIVHLQMLNQRGDYGHHTVVGSVEFSQPAVDHTVVGSVEFSQPAMNIEYGQIGPSTKMFPLNRLGYYHLRSTEFLRNGCLQFRIYINVKPKD